MVEAENSIINAYADFGFHWSEGCGAVLEKTTSNKFMGSPRYATRDVTLELRRVFRTYHRSDTLGFVTGGNSVGVSPVPQINTLL